ncbi:hypothetical protein Y1Q_0009845 [Alligator mississippiensis]|uniref:Uncharacterized protein n=1 Tax=Alligator mississippiensis TaxID=8496 RepID=A0A151MWV0_ALLMI|nr:hypothetical protein Y1Q_0009845 [Alligator mississippiensis]
MLKKHVGSTGHHSMPPTTAPVAGTEESTDAFQQASKQVVYFHCTLECTRDDLDVAALCQPSQSLKQMT